jgi:hypothetical protein
MDPDSVTVTLTLTVDPMRSMRSMRWGVYFPVLSGTSQQHLNLPLPTISLCTTNRVSVSHVFLRYVCACSVTTSVLFVFQSLCSPMLFVQVYTVYHV